MPVVLHNYLRRPRHRTGDVSVICPRCGGEKEIAGAGDPMKCPRCKGTGKVPFSGKTASGSYLASSSTPTGDAEVKPGDFVFAIRPTIHGQSKIRYRVTRIMPDGLIEAKGITPGLYEGSYAKLDPKELV